MKSGGHRVSWGGHFPWVKGQEPKKTFNFFLLRVKFRKNNHVFYVKYCIIMTSTRGWALRPPQQPQTTTKIPLKHSCNILETPLFTLETSLKQFLSTTETSLKHTQIIFKTPLEHPYNALEATLRNP